MNQFKVGDRVRIRRWNDMAEEFGVNNYGNISCNLIFTKPMEHLCGHTVEIMWTDSRNGEVGLGEWDDDSIDTIFNYSVDMIEPYKPLNDVPYDDFLKMLGFSMK